MGVEGNTSPRASPKKRPTTTLQHLFDLDSRNHGNSHSGKGGKQNHGNSHSGKGGKQSSPSSETDELLSIITYCTFVFTFTDPSESPSQQDLKRVKLTQLLSFVKSTKKPFHDQILSPLVSMLAANLFRPLPPSSIASVICELADEEDTSTPAPAWPHLQIVYEILLRLVLNTDAKALRDHIDHPFLFNLLSLFQSEDPRERDSLKNVYHRIYSKFTFYRSFMRKAMNDVFLQYVFETQRHCGIGDLLEIWGSIINGFTIPLKKEHKLFLTRVLIPLHKTKGLQFYQRQLAYCVSQFVQKEPVLGENVVRGILKYWPITNCQKEVLLVGELEELVEIIDPEQYRQLALPICTQITKSLNSWNSQVAERALYVLNNEHFMKMAEEATCDAFQVIVEGMEKNLKWHWSKSVRQLTETVKVMMQEMKPGLYSMCMIKLELREFAARQEETKRREKWKRIEQAAAEAAKQNQLTQPPQHCICASN